MCYYQTSVNSKFSVYLLLPDAWHKLIWRLTCIWQIAYCKSAGQDEAIVIILETIGNLMQETANDLSVLVDNTTNIAVTY